MNEYPRLSLRIKNPMTDHHVWNNNGTYFVHYTIHKDCRKFRIRKSLQTKELSEAIRRRDEFFAPLLKGSACGRGKSYHGRSDSNNNQELTS